jgi:hypothetical protein
MSEIKPKEKIKKIVRNFYIPEKIWNAMEHIRGDTPRNTFVVRAIREYVLREREMKEKIDRLKNDAA